MKQFFTLLKVDLINTFSLNKSFSKNKKNRGARKNSSTAGMIILFVMLTVMSFFYAFSIGTLANDAGMPELLLAYGIGVGSFTCLMLTFSNAYGVLFKSRDFELLASLPIDSKVIVASKIASLTIMGYAYFALLFVPSSIFYFIYAGASVVSVLVAIVVLLLGPLMITSVCSMIAFVFGKIVSHFKYKSIITTILYAVFVLTLVIGIYAISFTAPNDSTSAEELLAYVQKLYKTFTTMYPISPFAIRAIGGSIVDLLIYVAIMIVPYVLFVFIIGSNYVAINNRSRDNYKASNFDISTVKETKQRGVIKTLLQKEVKTLFSTPVYFLNVVMGPIMSLIIMIVIGYMFGVNKSMIFGDDSNYAYAYGVNVVCALSLFLGGIAPASCVSISMEGKKFWIVKSLPVDEKKYLGSKLLLSYLLMAPFNLIGSVVAVIMLKGQILDIICIILVPQIAAIFYSLIGLLFNLKFYNLEWDNPTQAVKQGANIILPMVIDFGLFIVAGTVLVFGFIFEVSLTPVLLAIVLVLCIIFTLVYRKNGVRLYNKISA